jgi:hypothetical protein
VPGAIETAGTDGVWNIGDTPWRDKKRTAYGENTAAVRGFLAPRHRGPRRVEEW